MPTIGTIGDKQQPLRAALEAETISDLMKRLVASTDWNSAFYRVESAIPCIMHGGNRIGEKMFMVMLIKVWNKCSSPSDQKSLIETVEHFINTGIFGTQQSKAQWKLPLNDNFELEMVSFTAWRVKKIIERLGALATVLSKNENDNRLWQWQEMLTKYLHMIKVAFQHKDFSDEEMEEFQDWVDEWFYLYMELVRLLGITNYMHLLGAGHLHYY